MRKYLLILSAILVACSSENDNNIPVSLVSLNTKEYKTKAELDNEISSILKILNEKSISDQDTIVHEFRCYYFPPFRKNRIYFKINYLDSILTVKEFQNKDAAGSSSDALLSSKRIQLGFNDFEIINNLIIKSLFWSLENFVYPYISIDEETYIYECRQPIPKKVVEVQKDYHVVKAVSIKNFDFVNLGQFFLYKAEHTNVYNEKY